MKKRIIALVAALTVLATATLTVGATAGSASKSANTANSSSVTIDASAIRAILSAKAAASATTAKTATSDAGTVTTEALPAETTTAAVNAASSVLNLSAGQTVSVLASYEVSLDGKTFPATISFDVAGVVAGGNYAVLHQKADGSWESVPCSVSNGKVTATFTSLSPVVIVEVQTATTGASPKTGEF